MRDSELLELLAEKEGFSDGLEMLEEYAIENVVPGICHVCHYTSHVEPDQTNGWCEVCRKPRVIACTVLGGLI